MREVVGGRELIDGRGLEGGRLLGDAQPLEELIGQIPGLAESLGGVSGGTGAGAPTPAPAPVSPGATEKYYDCVAKATSREEIDDCQKLLG